MHRYLSKQLCLMVLSGAALVRCSSDAAPNTDGGPDAASTEDAFTEGASDVVVDGTTGAADAADAAMTLTDLQIVTILHVANQGEIQAAQLALMHVVTSEARAFANQMVTDHTASDAALAALFVAPDAGSDGGSLDSGLLDSGLSADGGIPAAPSQISMDLAQQASLGQQALALKTGMAVDVAYLSDQVGVHSELIQLIDGVLTPNAENAALRVLLGQTRTMFAGHLSTALQDLSTVATRGPAD